MPQTQQRNGDPAVYKAMRVLVENGLRNDGSAFTPGEPVWTKANFLALRRHFIEQPDLSREPYLHKLRGQLVGATDTAVQLMAELHFVHLLLPLNVTGSKKREIIGSVLSFMQQPAAIPESLAMSLDHGFINPGTFYLTRRDLQLSYLIEFGEAWKALSRADQANLLMDPWAFKEFAFTLPVHSAYAQREGLLHLIHTEAFEAIVSREHKQLIVNCFAPKSTPPSDDVDRQLVKVREALTPIYGDEFDFYDERVQPQWRTASPSTPTSVFRVSDQVRLLQDVDRYPYAMVQEGATGVVVTSNPSLLSVRLDELVEGLEDWANELKWVDDSYSEDLERVGASEAPPVGSLIRVAAPGRTQRRQHRVEAVAPDHVVLIEMWRENGRWRDAPAGQFKHPSLGPYELLREVAPRDGDPASEVP